MLHHRAGDFPAALALYRESLEATVELNSAFLLRTALSLFVGLAAERQPQLAARRRGKPHSDFLRIVDDVLGLPSHNTAAGNASAAGAPRPASVHRDLLGSGQQFRPYAAKS
jgi:hypothetical protein